MDRLFQIFQNVRLSFLVRGEIPLSSSCETCLDVKYCHFLARLHVSAHNKFQFSTHLFVIGRSTSAKFPERNSKERSLFLCLVFFFFSASPSLSASLLFFINIQRSRGDRSWLYITSASCRPPRMLVIIMWLDLRDNGPRFRGSPCSIGLVVRTRTPVCDHQVT